MIEILTDSTSDLSQKKINQHNIRVIPLHVILNGKPYVDKVEITPQQIFRHVSETGSLPKTSAISTSEFSSAFSSPGEKLFIGIGANFSATVNNARIAASESSETVISVIDSMTLSSGIGLLVLLAADLRDQGLDRLSIEKEIIAAISKVRVSFLIETLEYLYKGGRCSALQNIFGSLLSIRPIIEVRQDGTMGVKAKIRSSRKKALDYLIDQYKNDLSTINLNHVYITHTGCDTDAEYLKSKILEISHPNDLSIVLAGSVITSHCGPDTIGLIYMLN